MLNFFKKKKTQGQTINFKIKGMHCVSCGLNIDGELEELAGIFEASTSYAKAECKINFDPKKISLQKIKNKISELGYQVVEN